MEATTCQTVRIAVALFGDLDPLDPGRRRALVTDPDQTVDRGFRSNGANLDAAVGAVADPAVDAKPARGFPRPAAVPDPLYPAPDAEADRAQGLNRIRG